MAESSNEKYKVPAGLRPLLEALVRETLRMQPTDLINFSMVFFNVLRKHCNQNNAEDVLKEPTLYECFKNDLQKQIRANPEKFGLSIKQSDDTWRSADCITEKDFKCHSLPVTSYDPNKYAPEDRAATIIQAEIRGFLTRRHVQQMKKEGDEAAKKIQAHIRGYLTRKHLDEVGIPRKQSTVLHLHNAI
uniref:RIIa domain-containing protein n=1 Tax=Setaria digitata TaxID=48799 RepID=A0A915PGW1_9BILA